MLGGVAFVRVRYFSSTEEPNHLPALERLDIEKCPSLTGNLPGHLPALKTLKINSCDKVELQEMPHSVQSVSIGGCEVMKSMFQAITITHHHLPALKTLEIGGDQMVKSMFQGITISHLTCLQSLSIKQCSSAISFLGDLIPVSVKILEISDCRKLEFPRQQHVQLEELSIKKRCDSLTSFPLESFLKLKYLRLKYCENLESFSMSQPHDVALLSLEITDCPNLVSFPGEGLAAPNMNDFRVSKCFKWKSLASHMNTFISNLILLSISDCPEIEVFLDGGLPLNLKSLAIDICDKLLRNLSS